MSKYDPHLEDVELNALSALVYATAVGASGANQARAMEGYMPAYRDDDSEFMHALIRELRFRNVIPSVPVRRQGGGQDD